MRKRIRTVLVMLISVLSIPLLIACILLCAWISGRIQDAKIENEIRSYVLDNLSNIPLENIDLYQEFVYDTIGLPTASVEYGYYYSPDDSYWSGGFEYRNGYRIDGSANESFDWYYVARICENWFYYEFHDG